jgi:hypothetical protein
MQMDVSQSARIMGINLSLLASCVHDQPDGYIRRKADWGIVSCGNNFR